MKRSKTTAARKKHSGDNFDQTELNEFSQESNMSPNKIKSALKNFAKDNVKLSVRSPSKTPRQKAEEKHKPDEIHLEMGHFYEISRSVK